MKKTNSVKQSLILMMAAMICMLCLMPVRANAASANYKSVYKKLLTKKQLSYKNSYNVSLKMKPSYFTLLDIDKNGVPELIVSNTSPSAGGIGAIVYTVKKGKAVFCGEYLHKGDSNVYYSSKHKALYDYYWINGIGGSGERLYRLSNSKLKEYKHMYSENKSLTSTKRVYKYASNGGKLKTITAAKSASLYKKYLKETRKIYKLKKNTAANRKKLLG